MVLWKQMGELLTMQIAKDVQWLSLQMLFINKTDYSSNNCHKQLGKKYTAQIERCLPEKILFIHNCNFIHSFISNQYIDQRYYVPTNRLKKESQQHNYYTGIHTSTMTTYDCLWLDCGTWKMVICGYLDAAEFARQCLTKILHCCSVVK